MPPSQRMTEEADGELYTQLLSLQLNPHSSADEASPAENCPVCKSSRYLNPLMKFLINPECYHRMCESCVDRIFSQGPAPCPVAGCGRTLRKARFKKQTFKDVKIERECDIRARIAAIFNRRDEEFTSLRAYNDYLEQVEDLAFNLIEGRDVAATEKTLETYARENAISIAKNSVLATREHSSLEAQEVAQREISRLSREEDKLAQQEERYAKEAERSEIAKRIAEGKTVDVEEIKKVVLMRSSARRPLPVEKVRQPADHLTNPPFTTDSFATTTGVATSDPSFMIKGLKKIEVTAAEKPYDPFSGLSFQTMYYALQDTFENPWLDQAITDPQIIAGGFCAGDYYSRAMLEAHAGLGCFIADELREREIFASGVGTTGAATVAAAGGGIGDVGHGR